MRYYWKIRWKWRKTEKHYDLKGDFYRFFFFSPLQLFFAIFPCTKFFVNWWTKKSTGYKCLFLHGSELIQTHSDIDVSRSVKAPSLNPKSSFSTLLNTLPDHRQTGVYTGNKHTALLEIFSGTCLAFNIFHKIVCSTIASAFLRGPSGYGWVDS